MELIYLVAAAHFNFFDSCFRIYLHRQRKMGRGRVVWFDLEQDSCHSKIHLVFVLSRHSLIKVELRALLKWIRDRGQLVMYTSVRSMTMQLCPTKTPERGFKVNIKLQTITTTSNPALEAGVLQMEGWPVGTGLQIQIQLQDKINRVLYLYLLFSPSKLITHYSECLEMPINCLLVRGCMHN